MATDHQRILILCKTYPSPSARYVETSCVAGMAEDGRLVRLFPVPFRLVEDDQQFKKWQWITARIRRAQDDVRTVVQGIEGETCTSLLFDAAQVDQRASAGSDAYGGLWGLTCKLRGA